jgi:hypothetical protein
MRQVLWVLLLSTVGATDGALAQDQRPVAPPQKETPTPQQPLKLGTLDVSVVWRNRIEFWTWFDTPTGNNDYGFENSLVRVSVGQAKKTLDWRLEASQPTVLSVPNDAVAPPPQGALGLGGSYYGANTARQNYGTFFLKQAFVQFKQLGQSTLKVGRFEFFDGTEAKISDPTVNGLVQSRAAHRLLSNEAFPAAQRSLDGALFSWNTGANTVSGLAARPTAGGVHLNGWAELDIEVYYGAYNRVLTADRSAGSFRVFGVGYVDRRDEVVKPDNRPAAIRAADRGTIAIGTYGADYVGVFSTDSAGKFDVIGWAAVQTGSWGTLSQRASSAFGEAGWQPPEPRLKPWLRAGYRFSSGDDNPLDGKNGTFYQVLGATRQYARFPFYNMMNLKDTYGLFAVRPSPKITLRSEVHRLRLANRADLWYGGGGPGQSDAFGYAGRPSFGHASLATFWDISADTQPFARLGANLYYGHASGHDVIKSTFPSNANGHFGYIETLVRF